MSCFCCYSPQASQLPADFLHCVLRSIMLTHSSHHSHYSMAHILISYPGRRGKIANLTVLPLDLAQVMLYLSYIKIKHNEKTKIRNKRELLFVFLFCVVTM